MAIHLCYDGSVNGDWIAHYAVNFAARQADRSLRVLHVENAEVSGAVLEEKFGAIRRLAERAGVRVTVEILPMRGGVIGGLRDRLPDDEEATVVCGVRVRGGRRGFLRGTVSAQLLSDQRHLVIALRVVQPGLLGTVQRMLLPVAGHRPGIEAAHRLLALFAPALRDLHLLHVVEVGALRFRRLDAARAGAMRRQALEDLEGVEREIIAGVDLDRLHVDSDARVSDDWVREVLLDAARTKADIIALEAQRASLAGGFTFGDPLEVIFRDTLCDVAVYRGRP